MFDATTTGWFAPATGNVVGRGTEGTVEGMQLRVVAVYDAFPISPESDSGFRIETNAKK